MALSRFPKVMPENVDAVMAAASVIRHVRNATGDLLFRDLDRIQSGLEQAKITFAAALTEAQKAPAAAESFMASVNGPATIADYQAKASEIETVAAAWNARLAQALADLSNAELIMLVTRPDSQTKHIERASFIPASVADPLRQSAELGALLDAFEAVGG